MLDLTSDKCLIFRITHIENVPWILQNGVHCRSSDQVDPDFVNIGNLELIEKRRTRQVPIAPGGTLSDYVPFYFTPRSPMLLNILTGYNGIKQRSRDDIVIFATSLKKLKQDGKPFVYTDRHAYLNAAQFFSDIAKADCLPWSDLRNCDFRRDPERPDKVERYQAEALVFSDIQMPNLLGIATGSSTAKAKVEKMTHQAGVDTPVLSKSTWYGR